MTERLIDYKQKIQSEWNEKQSSKNESKMKAWKKILTKKNNFIKAYKCKTEQGVLMIILIAMIN